MKELAPFLLLLICTSGVSCGLCDDTTGSIMALTGAAVTEVPAVSTFVNLFNAYVGANCIQRDLEEVIREVANNEDRKQEARNCASVLKAHVATLNEIKSYTDLKKNTYNNLRITMRRDRLNCFDAESHHHESKFQLFTEYASIELALLDMMINSGQPNKEVLERAYGDALLFYIIKGGEMAIKVPIKYAHEGNALRSSAMAKKAGKYLRFPLIQWMEHVETKREVRKRLSHKGLSRTPSSDKSQWIQLFSDKQLTYLPLKLKNNDWISFKQMYASPVNGKHIQGPNTWLSCWKSVDDEEYCREDRTCPFIDGVVSYNLCPGEKFQIQNTQGGDIKKDDNVAFFYYKCNDCGDREAGSYWLSYYGNINDKTKWWTRPCPGPSFTKSDISSCDREVFTVQFQADKPSGKDFKNLRNGDLIYLYIYEDSGRFSRDGGYHGLFGFILGQNSNKETN